jgi:DNA-binding HxlR family transcriptional regulator
MPGGGYNQFCPVATAAEVLGARWTLLLFRELIAGSSRFNDLRRAAHVACSLVEAPEGA